MTSASCNESVERIIAMGLAAGRMRAFYIAAAVLVIIIELAGLYVVVQTIEKPGIRQAFLILVFGIRSFDMFSDWVRHP